MGLFKSKKSGDEESPKKSGSLAISYGMKKKAKKYAGGGDVMKELPAKKQEPLPEEHGGDMVDRILSKCMSEGGMVANEQGERADEMPNEFDDLALRDDLDSEYDASNSGDDRGSKLNQEEDMQDRILRKRSAK